MKERILKSRSFIFVMCLCIYVVSGIILLKYYRYQINPDGISYISIAQKYLHGDFRNALNAYWGPMISWLMVPFLAVGTDGLLAAKIVTLSVGLAALVGISLLSLRFDMSDRVRSWIFVIMVPAMLVFALLFITPDILILCALIYYLFFIFDKEYAAQRCNGIMCGVLGGIAYLSKSFAFPFFSLHFLVFNVVHLIRLPSKEQRKAIIANYVLGMAVFGVISGLWIGAISAKYGELTFGTSAKFNRGLSALESEGHPVKVKGFFEPVNDTALSVWEDPTYFELKQWSSFDSWDEFKHQIAIVMDNLGSKRMLNPTLFPFFLPTILICALFFLPLNKSAFESSIFYSLLTIAIYCGLYALVLIMVRFLEIVYVLAILLAGQMLNGLIKNDFLSNRRKNLALAVFAVLFMIMPVKCLEEHTYTSKWIYDIAQDLKNTGVTETRLASNKNWNQSLYLAYHLKSRYFGMAKNGVTEEELRNDFEKFSIDYYMEWGNIPDHEFLSKFEDVTKGMVPNLRVYKIKP